MLRGRELERSDGVCAPGQRRKRLGPGGVPQLHLSTSSGKLGGVGTSLMVNTVEASVSQIHLLGVGVLVLHVPQLDGLVRGTRQQSSLGCHCQTTHNVLMGLHGISLLLRRQVPVLDHSVSRARRRSVEHPRVQSNRVHAVDVASSQLAHKRLCKHSLQLGGIQRFCVFSGSLKGMQRGVEVSGLPRRLGGSVGKIGVRGPRNGLDFHDGCVVARWCQITENRRLIENIFLRLQMGGCAD